MTQREREKKSAKEYGVKMLQSFSVCVCLWVFGVRGLVCTSVYVCVCVSGLPRLQTSAQRVAFTQTTYETRVSLLKSLYNRRRAEREERNISKTNKEKLSPLPKRIETKRNEKKKHKSSSKLATVAESLVYSY